MPAPSTSVRRSMGDGVALNSICSVRLLASRPIGRTLLGSTGVRQGALDAIEVLMDPARRSGLPASPRTATNCACATSADSTLASGFGREVRRAETRFEPHRASPSARLSGVAPRPDHDCAVQRSGQTSRNREPCPPDRRSYCASLSRHTTLREPNHASRRCGSSCSRHLERPERIRPIAVRMSPIQLLHLAP